MEIINNYESSVLTMKTERVLDRPSEIETVMGCNTLDCKLDQSKMHPDILKAIKSIDNPEVQRMLKRLSNFGLGIMVPHLHVDDFDGFAPLPRGMVQVEEDLQVSFQDATEMNHVIPVGWRWAEDEAEVETVMQCFRDDCGGAGQ